MQTKISLVKLFWIFFKISCVLFGGGYAMLPFLKAEMVDKEKICTYEEITDYYAMSQCFPGLVAGNISVLIGYNKRGLLGALACMVGVCLPAFLAIVLVYVFLNTILNNTIVENVFQVLDIAVCVLVMLTVTELWKKSIVDKYTCVIFSMALISSIFKISPFIIVISAGILGLARYILTDKYPLQKNKRRKE